MGKHPQRMTGWTYNEIRQEIRAPSGTIITLASVASRIQSDLACNYDFTGAWNGWRMRGDRLMPPHAGRSAALKPYTAPLFARWINDAARQIDPNNASDPPRLKLAYTSNR